MICGPWSQTLEALLVLLCFHRIGDSLERYLWWCWWCIRTRRIHRRAKYWFPKAYKRVAAVGLSCSKLSGSEQGSGQLLPLTCPVHRTTKECVIAPSELLQISFPLFHVDHDFSPPIAFYSSLLYCAGNEGRFYDTDHDTQGNEAARAIQEEAALKGTETKAFSSNAQERGGQLQHKVETTGLHS